MVRASSPSASTISNAAASTTCLLKGFFLVVPDPALLVVPDFAVADFVVADFVAPVAVNGSFAGGTGWHSFGACSLLRRRGPS
jgi:hypothetical protein